MRSSKYKLYSLLFVTIATQSQDLPNSTRTG